MLKQKNFRIVILVFFGIFLMILILFGGTVKEARAENDAPYIPEENPKNSWQWNTTIEVGDKLMYEITYQRLNATDQALDNFLIKDYFIINITSIENTTINWGGIRYVSQINATQLYYNCSNGQLYSYGDDIWSLASFQYNSTDLLYEHICKIDERLPIPFILPFNSTFINDLDNIAVILNKTSYAIYNSLGIMNGWTTYSTWDRTIRYENPNPNPDYFAEFRFLENGTLEYCNMYFSQYQGPIAPENLYCVNITLERIYNPNPLSEVQWEAQPGDTLYYGRNYMDPSSAEFGELKYDIVGSREMMNDTHGFRLYGDENSPRYTCFSYLISNVSTWNPETRMYNFIEENCTIAIANNHYPAVRVEDDDSSQLIIPKNTDLNDMKYLLYTVKFYQEDYPFDTSEVYEKEGLIIVNQTDYSWSIYMVLIYNRTTGYDALNIVSEDYYNIYDIAYQKTKITIIDDTPIQIKSYFGDFLKWNVSISVDNPEEFDLYTALLPVNHVNVTILDVFAFKDDLIKYQVFLEIYLNKSNIINETNSQFIFTYDEALVSVLNAKGYSERDLRPYFLFNDSSASDFDYYWSTITVEYIERDKENNQIIFSLPSDIIEDSKCDYLYITIGLSTSADIDFAVKPGDILHYGYFSDDPAWQGEVVELKCEVIGFDWVGYNMTEKFADMGFTFTGPGPEIQDFSVVVADVYYWNKVAKSWDFDSDEILGFANNYFPIPPPELGEDTGFGLLPIGTTGSDFIITPANPYDGAPTIQEGYIKLTSSSYPGRFLNLYFNETTGIITSSNGWIPAGSGEWSYGAQFLMVNDSLLSGENLVFLKSYVIKDFSVVANITTNTVGADGYYALLKENPVNETLSGNALFYLNTLIHEATFVNTIQLNINLSLTYDVSKMNIYVYYRSFDGTLGRYTWNNELPPGYEWSDLIIKNVIGNNITIILPLDPTDPDGINVLIAVMYTLPSAPSDGDGGGGGGGEGETTTIPGFNLYILLIVAISLISLVVFWKCKKIIKLEF